MVEATRGTSSLPVELLQQSFGHLEQPDVLRSAAVCVRWRTIAMQSRQYYRHIQYGKHLDWDGHGMSTQPVVALAQSFRDAIYESGPDGVRLSVSVCITFRNDDTEDEHFADFERKDDSQQPYRTISDMVEALIVPPIRDHLAQICKLDIDCSQSYYTLLLPAFCQPAPLLEHFRGYATRDHSWNNFEELPTSLFDGSAPLLQSVSCGAYETNMTLGKPIPAFAKASIVKLEDEAVFSIDVIPGLFPHARHLSCRLGQEYSSSEDVAHWEQRQRALQAFGERLRTVHLEAYSASFPPPSIGIDIVETFLYSICDAEFVIFQCENEAVNRIRPILSHMVGIRQTCLSIIPTADESSNRIQIDPYSKPFKITAISPTSLKSRVLSLSQCASVAASVRHLDILRNDLVELCIPHLFLGSCFALCASLPALEILRIFVYGRNRWRNSWAPTDEIFKVSDAVLPGNSILPQPSESSYPGVEENAASVDVTWPALNLLDINAPREGTVEVDSQSLLNFIHRFRLQGSHPVLSLTGPMVLRGEVTAVDFTSTAHGLGFSDVQFAGTNATGPPSFMKHVRHPNMFGLLQGSSMHDHQMLQYSDGQAHPSPFAMAVMMPTPAPAPPRE